MSRQPSPSTCCLCWPEKSRAKESSRAKLTRHASRSQQLLQLVVLFCCRRAGIQADVAFVDVGHSVDRRVSPLCLSPFFRLLRFCEEKLCNGDLEAINGLISKEVEVLLVALRSFFPTCRPAKQVCVCVCPDRLPSDPNRHGCSGENGEPVKG